MRAQAYVRALDAALEGLTSLRAALAPELAAKHGWPLPQIRDALTFCIGPTGKGSLIVPILAGGGDKGAQLATEPIAQAFWKETGAELGRVAQGKATRLSGAGADAFARQRGRQGQLREAQIRYQDAPRPAKRLRDRSAEKLVSTPGGEERAALDLRNRLIALLWDRMTRVRSVTRYVFRNQPELIRKVTSRYERRRRSQTKRAKAEAEPTEG